MSSDLEELAREGMSQFTAPMRVSPGLAARTCARHRRQTRHKLTALATGAATVTAGAAATTALTPASHPSQRPPRRPADSTDRGQAGRRERPRHHPRAERPFGPAGQAARRRRASQRHVLRPQEQLVPRRHREREHQAGIRPQEHSQGRALPPRLRDGHPPLRPPGQDRGADQHLPQRSPHRSRAGPRQPALHRQLTRPAGGAAAAVSRPGRADPKGGPSRT